MRAQSTLRALLWFALFFAALFSVIAYLQYWSVRTRLTNQVTASLGRSALTIDSLVNHHGRLDMAGYNNAYMERLSYYILASDGSIIDIEGPLFPLIGNTYWPYDAALGRPFTMVSSYGDTLRVLRNRVEGGIVNLAVVDPKSYRDPDADLQRAAAVFGTTLRHATRVESRSVPGSVEYAVTNDSGRITNAYGEVPLKVVSPPRISVTPQSRVTHLDGSVYQVLSEPILGYRNETLGLIVTYENISRSLALLASQAMFNIFIAAISLAVTLLLLATYLILSARSKSQEKIGLDEALARGEGQNIEFKRAIMLESLEKEIAAFSNTDSGNIFVGVDDNGAIIGLEEQSGKARDLLTQKIRNLTTQRIKPAVLPNLEFLGYGGKTILHIFVPRGNQPLYFVDGVAYLRHIESAIKAKPEEVEAIIKKFYKLR